MAALSVWWSFCRAAGRKKGSLPKSCVTHRNTTGKLFCGLMRLTTYQDEICCLRATHYHHGENENVSRRCGMTSHWHPTDMAALRQFRMKAGPNFLLVLAQAHYVCLYLWLRWRSDDILWPVNVESQVISKSSLAFSCHCDESTAKTWFALIGLQFTCVQSSRAPVPVEFIVTFY